VNVASVAVVPSIGFPVMDTDGATVNEQGAVPAITVAVAERLPAES